MDYTCKAWRQARAAAIKLCGARCAMCGVSVAGWKAARVDHIKPVRERPDLAFVPTNLRVLCATCDNRRHAEKGSRSVPRTPIGLDGYPE